MVEMLQPSLPRVGGRGWPLRALRTSRWENHAEERDLATPAPASIHPGIMGASAFWRVMVGVSHMPPQKTTCSVILAPSPSRCHSFASSFARWLRWAAERAHVCELPADVASGPVDLAELALQVPPLCGQFQELPLRVVGLCFQDLLETLLLGPQGFERDESIVLVADCHLLAAAAGGGGSEELVGGWG